MLNKINAFADRKMDLKGKNVLVTGGARGLGRLYVAEFLKKGSKVIMH